MSSTCFETAKKSDASVLGESPIDCEGELSVEVATAKGCVVDDRLSLCRNRSLYSRIGRRLNISPLTPDDTAEYAASSQGRRL